MILSARLCDIVQIFLIKHNLMYVKYGRVIFTASAERLDQVATIIADRLRIFHPLIINGGAFNRGEGGSLQQVSQHQV